MKSQRFRINRGRVETTAAPAWVVTYADLVTVLLCLFVAILSMSTIKQDRFQTALGSLHQAFGVDAASYSAEKSDQSLYARVQRVIGRESLETSVPSDMSAVDSWVSAMRTSNGFKLNLGGPLVFERGRAELPDDAISLLGRLADEMKECRCSITVRGHCAAETLQDDQTVRDLSYDRAATAARVLEQRGVPEHAISVVAVGGGQPLLDHAYTEKRRAMNRRVEIEVIEGDGLDKNILASHDKG